jgi:Transcriptional regulators
LSEKYYFFMAYRYTSCCFVLKKYPLLIDKGAEFDKIKVKRLRWEMVIIAATIKDVAKHAGVSIATVSKYINGSKVKEHNKTAIDQAIKALDFKVNVIARGLKTNKTMTVGVLIPSLENIFATSIVSNIEHVLQQNGYSTIICDYNQDINMENGKFDFLIDKLVDGIIIMPFGIDEKRVQTAMENEISVVAIDRPIIGVECDVVLVDNLNASYNAVEYLITHGHKEIAIICGPQNIFTAQERLKGYLRVHEDYDIEVNRKNIRYGDYEIQSGYKLMNDIISSESMPSAVYITNYEMTLGAIMAINEYNIKIPNELSIIGFDNQQLAKVFKPELAIIMQPIQQIGESAANLILKRLKGDKSNFPSKLRLKTEMIQGMSIK